MDLYRRYDLSLHYCAMLSSIFGLHQVGIEQSHNTEPPAAGVVW